MPYWEEMPEEVLVHWDRDGMSDLIESLIPNDNYIQGRPRFNKLSGHYGYRYFMFYGESGVVRAVYIANPVAHWRVWRSDDKRTAAAIHISRN